MFVPFDNISDDARVWVYPCSRTLSDQETSVLESKLESFVQNWLSHHREVHGSGMILENRFIILAADENTTDVSGCSIDSSVRFIREVEQLFNIQCFDRSHMYFISNDGQTESIDFREITSAWEKGQIQERTPVFNIHATNVSDIRTNWTIPMSASAYGRFLPVVK